MGRISSHWVLGAAHVSLVFAVFGSPVHRRFIPSFGQTALSRVPYSHRQEGCRHHVAQAVEVRVKASKPASRICQQRLDKLDPLQRFERSTWPAKGNEDKAFESASHFPSNRFRAAHAMAPPGLAASAFHVGLGHMATDPRYIQILAKPT